MTRAILLGLLVAGVFSLHGHAAEPDGPASLINAKAASRIDVQALLAAKAGGPAARKAQRDALINYYLVPDQNLLWVDENGLTERAKLVMAEIAKADDYGLRASRSTRCQIRPPSMPPIPRRAIGLPTPR